MSPVLPIFILLLVRGTLFPFNFNQKATFSLDPVAKLTSAEILISYTPALGTIICDQFAEMS